MKTDVIGLLFSALSGTCEEYRAILDGLLFEWGDPHKAEATGAFEIRLRYKAYDIVDSVSLVEGQVAVLSFLQFPNTESQIVRRKFSSLDELERRG